MRTKVEVTSPVLLPNERVIIINNKESLRCHLLLDGRHEKLDMQRQREQDFEGLSGQTVGQGIYRRVFYIELCVCNRKSTQIK